MKKNDAIRGRQAVPVTLPQPEENTGGAGGTGGEQSFDDYLAAMTGAYSPELIEYIAPDEQSLYARLSELLRPAYDFAAAERRRLTAEYHAETDADALSRGLGSSSYTGYLKTLQKGDEAQDIAMLRAEYTQLLAGYLMQAMENEREREQEIALFNAGQINDARENALGAALSGYRVSGSGGGSGSGARSGGITKDGIVGYDGKGTYDPAKSVEENIAAISGGRGGASYEQCERLIKSMNAEERALLYGSREEPYRQLRDDMIVSLGYETYRKLKSSYPA